SLRRTHNGGAEFDVPTLKVAAMVGANASWRPSMAEEQEIIFEKRGRAGIITLNRPKALNALNANMVARMHPQLVAWAGDPSVELVIVRAAGEKAFCAGGDIRQLHDWGR